MAVDKEMPNSTIIKIAEPRSPLCRNLVNKSVQQEINFSSTPQLQQKIGEVIPLRCIFNPFRLFGQKFLVFL